jgi:hypothetical protein
MLSNACTLIIAACYFGSSYHLAPFETCIPIWLCLVAPHGLVRLFFNMRSHSLMRLTLGRALASTVGPHPQGAKGVMRPRAEGVSSSAVIHLLEIRISLCSVPNLETRASRRLIHDDTWISAAAQSLRRRLSTTCTHFLPVVYNNRPTPKLVSLPSLYSHLFLIRQRRR